MEKICFKFLKLFSFVSTLNICNVTGSQRMFRLVKSGIDLLLIQCFHHVHKVCVRVGWVWKSRGKLALLLTLLVSIKSNLKQSSP